MKTIIKNISFFGLLFVIGCAIFISLSKNKDISDRVAVPNNTVIFR